MTLRKKIALLAVPGLLVAAAFTFAFVNAPANTLTFDVNPSIELVTNRLDDVIEINPLNDDAEALLKDYSPIDRDLEDVVNDLVDRMILTGYISGGQDNLVMITVQDNQANEALVDRVNKMIAAFLENKQIEATIVNKRLDVARDELNKDGISSGKLAVIETLLADDDRLSREALSEMKVSELVAVAKALDLKPSTLFDAVLDDDDFDDDDFDLDDDFSLDDDSDLNDDIDDDDSDLNDDSNNDDSDDDSNLDDDWKDDDHDSSDNDSDDDDDRSDDRNSVSSSPDSVSSASASASVNVTVSENVISADRARTIALNRVSGDIIKLSLDADDDDRPEYDVEILSGNLKYEIEIDAVTGQILKVESESVLNDDDRNELNDDAVLDDSDDDDHDVDEDDIEDDDEHDDDDNDDAENDDSDRDDD